MAESNGRCCSSWVTIDFEEKARENLSAARRLLPDDEGTIDGLPNAAASRAYYAAYLAVAHRAQALVVPISASKDAYYRHDTLPDDAVRHGILDDNGRRRLEHLRDLRVKPDYLEDHVDFEEADHAVAVADDVVRSVLDSRGAP